MSERSTFGPLGTSIAPVASAGAGPTKVGGALATPTSSCQFLATRPSADAAIRTKKTSTTASDDDADAVGAEAPPGGVPDAFGAFGGGRGAIGAGRTALT